MSPTGGGSRSIQINTAISQNVDVPEEFEDEEIRSVSTLYNAADAKKKADEQRKLKENAKQRRLLEIEEEDQGIILAENFGNIEEKASPFPKTVSTSNF